MSAFTKSYYNSSNVCVFVCLWVCSLSPPRSFGGSSPNLVGVCSWTSHLPLRGSFSKRSTGQRVNGSLSLSTILYMCQPHSTQLQRRFLLAGSAAESNSAPFAALHVNGVCRWTSQLLLRGSFSKRSTGRRVNGSTGQTGQRVNGSTGHFHFHYIIYDSRRRQSHGSPLQKPHGLNGLTGQWVHGSTGQTGQRVTFTFTILYMIADDARLTPPRCKKHTAYDDTTPPRCKKHTASFARSTGKFPSTYNSTMFWNYTW